MLITTRNFLKLLRAGAFGEESSIEPMSAWKWQQTYQLSLLHGVGHIAWQGVVRLHEQFFMQLPDDLRQQWQQVKAPVEGTPVESKKLRRILEDTGYTSTAYELLCQQYHVAHHFLNDGLFLHDLIRMGQFVRQHSDDIEFELLLRWQRQLGLGRLTEFENLLLVELLGFLPDELLPQETATDRRLLRYVIRDLGDLSRPRSTQWAFEQSGDIFVHASNSSAMLWQARRSMHYFRYCPAESVTNILTSFARSLSQIEE
ncbi:MAG: hypothetical protein II949_15040 [Prevotella sp.]|nr:hypothetical protein [Prevotella sp.]